MLHNFIKYSTRNNELLLLHFSRYLNESFFFVNLKSSNNLDTPCFYASLSLSVSNETSSCRFISSIWNMMKLYSKKSSAFSTNRFTLLKFPFSMCLLRVEKFSALHFSFKKFILPKWWWWWIYLRHDCDEDFSSAFKDFFSSSFLEFLW